MKYQQSINEIGLSSLNFQDDHIWLNELDDKVFNPYNSLPSLFENWSTSALDTTLSELDGIDNGGTALVAYAKLQYTDMTEKERLEIKSALLKYCELDTLAMVMIYEHWLELISKE